MRLTLLIPISQHITYFIFSILPNGFFVSITKVSSCPFSKHVFPITFSGNFSDVSSEPKMVIKTLAVVPAFFIFPVRTCTFSRGPVKHVT